ncbi:MAG: hypothetical protein KDD64_06485 [Bdellovibrionales bacterium]|nr:hypothetical protein [Bdellovibrionales bacterium]
MNAEVIVAIIFSLFAFGVLLSPYLRNLDPSRYFINANELRTLLREKEQTVQRLRDLESDFSAGTLSEIDYSGERETLRSELATILTKLDSFPTVQ